MSKLRGTFRKQTQDIKQGVKGEVKLPLDMLDRGACSEGVNRDRLSMG